MNQEVKLQTQTEKPNHYTYVLNIIMKCDQKLQHLIMNLHFLDIWKSFVSSNALHSCNINVINTNHLYVLTGISITRDDEDQFEEETAPLIIQLTIIVQNMTRQKANVLMETSKLT